ncbi:MAG: hypothetical protein R3C10_01950 [Pirellulales bacterium]
MPAGTVINMLKIPGEQQVMLRVKIAELNRTAARFGVDLDISIDDGNLVIQSMLNAASGSTASIIGMFDGDDVNFGIHYLEQHGVLRLLSEPTLVTLSGRPASFLAGGEFAVPTTVGVGGAAAVTTDFRVRRDHHLHADRVGQGLDPAAGFARIQPGQQPVDRGQHAGPEHAVGVDDRRNAGGRRWPSPGCWTTR